MLGVKVEMDKQRKARSLINWYPTWLLEVYKMLRIKGLSNTIRAYDFKGHSKYAGYMSVPLSLLVYLSLAFYPCISATSIYVG